MMTEQRFTKLFKFLFEDPTFNELPAKAKLLYSLLTERQNLSKSNAKQYGIQSQFIDEEGRLFSIYSNDELINKIKVSEPTLIKLKKQLIESDLLEEVRLGKNQTNRLYPKKPYDKYFYAYDIDEFYRIPHALFDNPYYKNLSADSIIAYAFYLSRYEYSVYKSHFSDNNNSIYCVLTNEEMALRLSCERKKISRIKNELISCGLLISQKSTLGKANRIYINLPKTSHLKELKKWDVRNLKNGTSGTKKTGRQELKKWDTSDIDSSDIDSSDIDSSDMYDKKRTYTSNDNENSNHSSHTDYSNQTNGEFNDQKTEQDMLLQNLPEAVQINLKYFNNLEIRCIKDVMNKAKANYNKHVSIEERVTYEDCAYDIGEALRRIKLLNRQKNENVCDLAAYMMQTFKNVFVDYIRKEQQKAYLVNKKENNFSIANFEPQNDMQAMAKKMFMNHI
ncbi:replication initiator protein A [Staphylococcus saccharolyticus]|nr:replication initiator protein A [Staphylococcus saccharolyticus]TAA90946.1 replication protein [Staphylococcus saccharolyticus]TAA90972.1 replication protein [Staphylococcus saccharolyticus]